MPTAAATAARRRRACASTTPTAPSSPPGLPALRLAVSPIHSCGDQILYRLLPLQRQFVAGLECCSPVIHCLAGVKAAAADTSLPAAGSATYSYTEGLHKTLIFFESMRSGKLDRQRLAWYAFAAEPTAAIAPVHCKGVAHVPVGTPRWQHRQGPIQRTYSPQYRVQHHLTCCFILRAGAATRAGTAWGQMARMSAAGTMKPAAPS